MRKRWLKRPQWSLRSFLVVYLVLAATTGWIARKCYIARQSPISMAASNHDEIVHRLRDSGALDPDFNVVRIVRHRIESRSDPPRNYPLIGAASLHHDLHLCIVIGVDGWIPRVEIVCLHRSYFLLRNAGTHTLPEY